MPIEFAPPIAQGVQPFTVPAPQSVDPLQTLAQMGQLRTQNLQQQSMGMQVQQQQMDLQSQQGFMKAYQAANGDLDQALKIAPQYGVLPKDIYAAQKMYLDAATARANQKKTESEAHDMWRDQVHQAFQPAFDETDPDKQPVTFATIRQNLINQGLISPNDKVFDYTTPENAKLLESSLTTDKSLSTKAAQINAQTAQKRLQLEEPELETKAEDAQRASTATQLANVTNPADYEAIRDKYIIAGGKENKDSRTATFPASGQAFDQNGNWIPGMQRLVNSSGISSEQRQQAVLAQVPKTEPELVQAANDPNRPPADRKAANDALTQLLQLPKTDTELALLAVDPKATPERRQQAEAALRRVAQFRLASSPQFNVTIPGLTGGGSAGGGTQNLTGEDFLATLPAATAAQIKAIAEGRDNMPPASSRNMSAVALRNAVYKYDPGFNEQRAQIRKAFTTGNDGRNIGNLNTAAVHAQQFEDAANALKNGSFQPGNTAWNAMRTLFGSNAPTNLEAIKNVWAGEMASALKGNATDPEIASIKAGIAAAASPEQFAGVVQENLKALGAKLNTYYERAQQQDVGNWNPILPSARAVFQNHGMDPTAGPGGGGNQTGAPQNYKVGDSVMYQGKPHKITAIDPATGKLTIQP